MILKINFNFILFAFIEAVLFQYFGLIVFVIPMILLNFDSHDLRWH